MILDQPISKTPVKKTITLFELVVSTTLSALTIFNEVLDTQDIPYKIVRTISIAGVLVPGGVLTGGYLFCFYWIDKPRASDGRAIFLTILHGIGFAFLATSWVYFALFAEQEAPGVAMTGLCFIGFAFALDIATLKNDVRITSNTVLIRLAVFLVALFFFYLIKAK